MSLTPLIRILSLALLLAMAGGTDCWAQSGPDRRQYHRKTTPKTAKSSRGLLEAVFGKRKSTYPRTTRTTPAPGSVPGGTEPRGETAEVTPLSETAPSESVAAAISAVAEDLKTEGSKADLASAASKALEGREDELKSLTQSLDGDPDKLLSQGQKLLRDTELSETARKALGEAMSQGTSKPELTPESLEKMKETLTKVAGDQDLLASGQKLLNENRGLLSAAPVQEILGEAPPAVKTLAEARTTPPPSSSVPSATVVPPAAPLPRWVGKEVPLPEDPVVEPMPRPEVQPEQVTKIRAEYARFDANTNVVTFEENVELDHHEFDLSCQVLVAELKPDSDGEKPDPNVAKARAASGGIRRAIAKGFVIIEKLSADGKVQVAKSRHAIYDAESGDVILSDFPQLQDGNSLISGSTQTTKIYLRKNGKYEVKGLAEYEIVPEGDPLDTFNRGN